VVLERISKKPEMRLAMQQQSTRTVIDTVIHRALKSQRRIDQNRLAALEENLRRKLNDRILTRHGNNEHGETGRHVLLRDCFCGENESARQQDGTE
jgi:hypothetical protein